MNFLHFHFHFPIITIIISIFFITSLWFLNFLFFITSSSDVWFLIRLILWCTHNIDFLGIVPDNQIRHSLLHIFHRIMWGSMRENLYFPWPVFTFIGALRPSIRLVSRFLYFILLMISCNPFIAHPFNAAVHNCSRFYLAAPLHCSLFWCCSP